MKKAVVILSILLVMVAIFAVYEAWHVKSLKADIGFWKDQSQRGVRKALGGRDLAEEWQAELLGEKH